MKRLLTDVQETVTKNTADETIVLSALETFHQQLESSLTKEVQALKSTLGTLENAQTDEITQVRLLLDLTWHFLYVNYIGA